MMLFHVACSDDSSSDVPDASVEAGAEAGTEAGVDGSAGASGSAGTSGIDGAAGAAGSTAGLCPWQHPKGSDSPLLVEGTTTLSEGDVALLMLSGTRHGLDESCAGRFVAARVPIVPLTSGGGTFSLSIPAPPPPGAFEVAESWPEEYAKSPRLVSGLLVALKPGTPDLLDPNDLGAAVAFVALDLVVYAYTAVPAGDALFASWLYGPLAPGHHLIALTEKLTQAELEACVKVTTPDPNCICWYSTPDSTAGYGYCSVAERSVIPNGTSIAIDVPYSGSNLYSM
jgi:hypothetical protein